MDFIPLYLHPQGMQIRSLYFLLKLNVIHSYIKLTGLKSTLSNSNQLIGQILQQSKKGCRI